MNINNLISSISRSEVFNRYSQGVIAMKLMQKSYVILLICSLLLTGCIANYRRDDVYTDEDASSGVDIGEEKVDLSAANVQVTEADYQQMKEIQEELKDIILNKTDSGKLSQLIEQIPTEAENSKDGTPWADGNCYLSSIPLFEWDCQYNNIYDIKLPVFSKDM